MKPEELMVGDWVRTRYTDFLTKEKVVVEFQVDGIRRPWRNDPHDVWSENEGNMGWVIRAEGISLTPEILKKNGFMHFHPENKKAEYWQIYCKDGDINVKITYGHFRFFITGKPIQKEAYRPTFNGHLIYVHELQHALRLCGIEKEIKI